MIRARTSQLGEQLWGAGLVFFYSKVFERNAIFTPGTLCIFEDSSLCI